MLAKIKIEIISGLYEDFINCLVEKEIYISSVMSTDFGVTCICMAKDYAHIARLAKKFQCRTKICKRKGVYYLFKGIVKRKSVAVAVCSVFIYIFLFTKLIWRIEIISPNQQINQSVYNLLYNNQVYAGAVFSQEKNQNIIQQIFMSVEDVGYVTLNFYKGTLTCKIDPVQEKMLYLEKASTGNIVASQNGVIEDLRVYSGFSDVKIGQTVEKGQILVSATYIDRNGKLQQVMPRAYIKAHCVKKYTAQIEMEKEIYLRTGESTEGIFLKALGKDITLKRENISDYINYDTEKSFKYISILGFKLPFTVEKAIYYKKEATYITKDEQTAYSAAKNIIDTMIKNDIALEETDWQDYSYTVIGNQLTIECTVQGHYDITK